MGHLLSLPMVILTQWGSPKAFIRLKITPFSNIFRVKSIASCSLSSIIMTELEIDGA
jgi:hypothetical protein